MISASGSTTVAASPRDVLEFVLDLGAYRQVDHKIVRVYDSPPVDAVGDGYVLFRGSMRGLRGPKQRNRVKLIRWTSLTFDSDGPWLAARTSTMHGRFEVTPGESGTDVVHSYEFRFKPPFGGLIERRSRSWLQADLDAELERMR